jgi:ATP-dependent Clp protease ATP-binding subunit ClpA
VVQRSEQADRVLDLARVEADLFGHCYLGPEHLVLGVLRDGGSGASQILEANGVNLIAARAELRRLAERRLVPGPRPSDAELLNTLGIHLATIRQTTEQALATRRWGGRSGRRPERDDVGLGGCRGRRCVTRRC